MLALAWAFCHAPLSAQGTARVVADARLVKAPGAVVLGTLLAGTEVTSGRTQGDAVEITLEGWIANGSLVPSIRDGFDLGISRQGGETLRRTANGSIIARLNRGTGFTLVEKQDRWTHVRRTAWIPQKSLALPPPGPTGPDAVEAAGSLPFAYVAGGPRVGLLDSGTTARVLARSGPWTRVQIEAWVPDSGLRSAPNGPLVGLSQAEVRANPTRYVGQLVEWRVQYVAVQRGDELRPEIPQGRPYLLARGPLPEPGFVYVIIPPGQAADFEALPPLKELTIRATIKSATTKYLPTPVVELVSVVGDPVGKPK